MQSLSQWPPTSDCLWGTLGRPRVVADDNGTGPDVVVLGEVQRMSVSLRAAWIRKRNPRNANTRGWIVAAATDAEVIENIPA